jgi:hypothetical protein
VDGVSIEQIEASEAGVKGWPSFIRVTRPNRVHFRYGSQVHLPRLRPADCSASRSFGYMLNG